MCVVCMCACVCVCACVLCACVCNACVCNACVCMCVVCMCAYGGDSKPILLMVLAVDWLTQQEDTMF